MRTLNSTYSLWLERIRNGLTSKNRERIPSYLHKDPNFILDACCINEEMLNLADPELLNNRDFILRVVLANGYAIKHVPDKYKVDPIVAICAFMFTPGSIEFVSKEVENNLFFQNAIKDIRENGCSLKYLTPNLRTNEQVVRKFLRANPSQISEVEDCFKDDYDFMVLVNNFSPASCLNHASKRLRASKHFMFEVTKRGADRWEYADKCLIDDEVTMLEAVKINKNAFAYCSPRLKNKISFVKQIVQIDPKLIKFASEKIQDNKTFALFVLSLDKRVYKYLSIRLQIDPDIMKMADVVLSEKALSRKRNELAEAMFNLHNEIDESCELLEK